MSSTRFRHAILRLLRSPGRARRRLTQARLVARGFYDPTARSQVEAIFIGGCPRSGTTLLRELLGRHPHLACGVETAILVPAFEVERVADRCRLDRRELERTLARCHNLVELADLFYADLLRREGKQRWVDKAPANVRVIGQLLAWYPRGRFLNVVRDGRDLVCSLRNHPREVLRNGVLRPVSTDRPVEECARTWVEETSRGLAYRGHPRLCEVRYERLVARPEEELQRVCTFLAEELSPAMLQPGPNYPPDTLPARFANNPNAGAAISRSSVGRWRSDLTRSERSTVAAVAGELLVALGYAEDSGWVEL